MLIYQINVSLLTYFLTYLYFLWAWPKGVCRIQIDKKLWGRLKTARGRGAPIPVLITFRCLRLMRPLSLNRSAYGLATSVSMQLWAWPRNLCIEPRQKLLYQI